MYYVYRLRGADGTDYIDCTHDLAACVLEHRSGLVRHTATSLPLRIISVFAVADYPAAILLADFLKTSLENRILALKGEV